VSKLIHLVYHKTNIDLYYEILMKFKRIFVKGGVKRMKYTIPATVFSLFRLSHELIVRPPVEEHEEQKHEATGAGAEEDEMPMKLQKVDQMKIFKVVSELINNVKAQYPELALRLFLQGAEAINRLPNF
jgi:hypothetical protein